MPLRKFIIKAIVPSLLSRPSSRINSISPNSISYEGRDVLISKVNDLAKLKYCLVITVADEKFLFANCSRIGVNTRAPDIVLRFLVLFLEQLIL